MCDTDRDEIEDASKRKLAQERLLQWKILPRSVRDKDTISLCLSLSLSVFLSRRDEECVGRIVAASAVNRSARADNAAYRLETRWNANRVAETSIPSSPPPPHRPPHPPRPR